MKRKLALLLAAVMVAAMVPVSAFAKSTNTLSNTVAMKKKDNTITYNTPSLNIKFEDTLASNDDFELVLDGAEWKIKNGDAGYTVTDVDADGYLKVGKAATYAGEWTLLLLDANTLSVSTSNGVDTTSSAVTKSFPIVAKVTGDEATITVVPNDTEVSAGTYTFALTTDAAATATVNGKATIEEEGGAKELKSIVITETVANALENGKKLTLKLYGDFKFVKNPVDNSLPGVASTLEVGELDLSLCRDAGYTDGYNGKKELSFYVNETDAARAGKLVLTNIWIAPDGAEAGDVAEIVISGAGVAKTTLEVADVVSYGVSFTVEDKKLPVFYAGRKYATDATLQVTFKELAEDSWWAARKTTLTFPEGVKVIDVEFTGDVAETDNTGDVTWKNNVVTIAPDAYTGTAKAEWKAKFNLSISPDFAGDVTCTVGGPAVKEDITVVVAEAQYPVTFEVEVSDVSIDYRNVAVGDITIKETFAGALKEGTVLGFFLDKIDLEGKAKVEVVEGDIEVEIEDYSDEWGAIELLVTDASYKAPATIKISGVEAYLDRSLPAGSYALNVTSYGVVDTDNNTTNGYEQSLSLFENYADKTTVKNDTVNGWFAIDSYELAEAYIEVVTAGRDQDDSSFTTSVKVTVGANEMAVGQGTVALEVPAYIANGYTMLPVRAVADALSNDAATVIWNGETKTVTIAFGARIISMTIGSKVMNINGVEIGMNAAPEITNNRTFLPLRDLGYALGLTDADIAWDDTTKTATLN